jgi:hypothetical protein
VGLVDFWHLMEKLGLAAVLIHGVLAPAVLERWKLSLPPALTSPSGRVIRMRARPCLTGTSTAHERAPARVVHHQLPAVTAPHSPGGELPQQLAR